MFAVVGTLDSDDRIVVKVARGSSTLGSAATLADHNALRGTNQEATISIPAGRNLMRVWGDEDGTDGGAETHFFRVNVRPYWTLGGERLSESSVCRSSSDRAASEITDDDCIVNVSGADHDLRFHNPHSGHYNTYVDVNGARKVSDPDATALVGAFPLTFQGGDNVLRVRLARKHDQAAENFGSDAFYYKVTTDFQVLVSNLGQAIDDVFELDPATPGAAMQFTTGSETTGYTVSQVRLTIEAPSGATPRVSIYSDASGSPGSSLSVLTNPSNIPTTFLAEKDFNAGDYRLEPDTDYWIVIDSASWSGTIAGANTTSTSEDAGAAPGWSIGDEMSFLSGTTWIPAGSNLTILVAIKGAVAQAVAPVPDLVVDGPTVTDSSPEVGASFTLNATVRNQGDGAANATTLRYYRSSDTTVTTSDTLEGTDPVGGLAAGGSSAESISITAPSTPGTYYYGACVDAVSGETATDNNCSPAIEVTAADTTPPSLLNAVVSETVLTLTYNEPLDTGSTPAASRFTVQVNGNTRTVTGVRVAGSAVRLTLSSAVGENDEVTVSYAVPGTNPIQDAAGNDAGALTNQGVLTDALGPILLGQPGISVPQCQSNGISMYWHTKEEGEAPAPDGWIVERRHYAGDAGSTESTRTWRFIGADADALQTRSSRHWDWRDRSARKDVSYTYRVRAINSDGSFMADREWSRRAPVRCD